MIFFWYVERWKSSCFRGQWKVDPTLASVDKVQVVSIDILNDSF